MKTTWPLLALLTLLACGAETQTSNPSPTPNPAAPYVPSGTPNGACILQYNRALRTPACCYAWGGANTCDQGIACNAQSGAQCCRIYSTTETTIGMGCCLFSDRPVGADRQAACAALLAGR